VDIPKYLEKSLKEDIESLPNMDAIAHETTETVAEISLQEKLEQNARMRY